MNPDSACRSRLPVLPRPLVLPLAVIPARAHGAVLAATLNRLFAGALRRGELDFLRERVVCLRVRDAGLAFRLTLAGARLQHCQSCLAADLTIDGVLYDYLQMAAGREDPDTLFFNRRLRMTGDTELGLFLKNFLAASDLQPRPGPGLRLAGHALDLVQRFAPGKKSSE
jgi:predicted lipid carrier protein YhbT